MNPDQRQILEEYYDRMVQDSIDLKHKVYNQDMRDYLKGKRQDVRFSEEQTSYIVINNEVYSGWQQAADYLGVSIQKLMKNYYNKTHRYNIEVLKTTDKPKKMKTLEQRIEELEAEVFELRKKLIIKEYNIVEPIILKKEFPKTWEDLGFPKEMKNVYAKKEQAEASIALAQLSQLRDVYRDRWEPDWNDEDVKKWCIYFSEDYLIVNWSLCHNFFLSFQDYQTANLFFKNFRDLIEQAKPLLG